LEHDYSTVRVNDAAGARVDRQDAHVDPSNPLLLRVTLQPLEHGAYTVIWRVLSVDSHVTEGRFTFRVE
jgi:methionine-rich copper-binding protein CopC